MADEKYTIIDWIVYSGKIEYGNILGSRQNVLQGIQKWETEGNDTNDKLKIFRQNNDIFNIFSPSGLVIGDEITNNNNDWVTQTLSKAESANDEVSIGAVRQQFKAERGLYEDDSSTELDSFITAREAQLARPPEERLTRDQRDNIINILGVDEETIDLVGIRQIQRQLEEQVKEEIETATSLDDLRIAENNIGLLQTKIAIRELRKELKEKRKELESDL